MTEKILQLQQNIETQKFFSLMELCFQKAQFFSLASYSYNFKNKQHAQFLERLDTALVRNIRTQHWFRQYVPQGYGFQIHLYRATTESKKVLMECFDNLFLFERNAEGTLKRNHLWQPEDLCFFEENSLFLGTVSHEYIGTVYPSGDDFLENVRALGSWQEADCSEEELVERIDLLKYEDKGTVRNR